MGGRLCDRMTQLCLFKGNWGRSLVQLLEARLGLRQARVFKPEQPLSFFDNMAAKMAIPRQRASNDRLIKPIIYLEVIDLECLCVRPRTFKARAGSHFMFGLGKQKRCFQEPECAGNMRGPWQQHASYLTFALKLLDVRLEAFCVKCRLLTSVWLDTKPRQLSFTTLVDLDATCLHNASFSYSSPATLECWQMSRPSGQM